jgi:hypothetical protein
MNGLLAIPSQPLEDGSTRWIGECPEDVVCGGRHVETIAKWLWIVKTKMSIRLAGISPVAGLRAQVCLGRHFPGRRLCSKNVGHQRPAELPDCIAVPIDNSRIVQV